MAAAIAEHSRAGVLPSATILCSHVARSLVITTAILFVTTSVAVSEDPPSSIQRVTGRHLTLYTDVPIDDAVREIPAVFTQAVEQWQAYFGRSDWDASAWHMRGYLMQNPDRFRQAGWLPDDLPPFPHGYQRGDQFWLYDQPSAYFRRHLALHEGTHGVMQAWGASHVSPWYREAIAERLGTHRWESGRLQLGWYPSDREQVPYWGRIKMVRDEIAQSRYRSLAEVIALPDSAYRRTQGYAWSWAAMVFLDEHPLTRTAVRDYRHQIGTVADPGPDPSQWLGPHAAALEDDWYLFVHNLDYGMAPAAAQVPPSTGDARAVPKSGATRTVEAQLGWQDTGLRLEAETDYLLRAEGRFVIATETRPWWCEAEGVTIEYVNGWPLGRLLAAVVPDQPGRRGAALAQPQPVGRQGHLRPTQTGVLFLRVNEPAAQRHDNEGALQVTVTHPDSPP